MTKSSPQPRMRKSAVKPRKVGKTLRKVVIIPEGASYENDKQAIFLELLLVRTVTREECMDAGFWVNISSSHLRGVMTKEYRPDVQALIDSSPRQVEENPHYLPGEFSKSYRLAQHLRTGRFRSVILNRARPSTPRFTFAKWDKVGRRLAAMLKRIQLPSETRHLGDWDQLRFAAIQAGCLYANRCKFNRFHSSFTSLSKEARGLLKSAGGKPLVEIDIKNCQPLLLWVLLNQMSPQGSEEFEPLYLQLCEAGKVYEYLSEVLSDIGLPTTRSGAKELFIKLLFQKIDGMLTNPLWPVVFSQFPDLCERMIQIKTHDYRELAQKLQGLESTIMIDGVCSKLLDESPQRSLVTIHDSILVEQDRVERVVREIMHQFTMRDVTPQVSVAGSDYQAVFERI